jgi:tripartite-type tricarboxylate transporter receptor subunit TctC
MTPIKRFRSLWGAVLVLAATGFSAWPSTVAAQAFPSGPIRIYVPTAPSTPPDIISRVVANELARSEGWKIVVENHPGGVMTIAGSEVLKRPADGTSIYVLSVPVTAAPAFLPNMPFQVNKDFVPVIKVSTSYNVLVVHPSVAANSVSELVDLIKRNPDKMTFSSGGFGTPAHLIGELFKLKTGVRATHVPYQQFPQE